MSNISIKEHLENNNWNENGSEFHIFNNQDELNYYLARDSNHHGWREEYGRFDFEQSIFNFKAVFKDITFNEIVSFKNAKFNFSAIFNYCKFEKNADFDGCHFKNNVAFIRSVFKEEFYTPARFEHEVDFSFAKFHRYIHFCNTTFKKNTKFNNTKFFQGADFESTTFEERFTLYDAEIYKNITFEGADFIGKVDAWKLTCHADLNFKWANFRNKVNLSELNVNKGNTNFHGTNFEKNGYFYNSNLSSLDLTHSVIDKSIFFLNAKIDSSNRETWRIIKHEFIKNNNKIESLHYYALEMKEFENEKFDYPKRSESKLLLFFTDLLYIFKKNHKSDKFILFVNRISNGYNMEPFKGVRFTITSTILLYIILIYSIKLENDIQLSYSIEYLGINIKQALQLINITNWNYKPFNKDYEWSYIILFLSRIIISFGLYQTIQAFRKYGKS
jgi:uncharacterized protein YjbI with pentapeptide repeats|tara:strand:- start:530 stop:1864 length:1335 start_codon:yes stop_codon:yes gene_type:complete